jgi:hypothetical protein
MPNVPQPTYQYAFGPAANGGDILQFKNNQGVVVSWIDNQGYGWGQLAAVVTPGTNFADAEVPSGGPTNFTLLRNPVNNSTFLCWNGGILTLNVDYTISGNSLVTTQAVEPGDQFHVWYNY